MTTKQILIQTRQLLSKRGAWIKGDLAKSDSGRSVSPYDDLAVSWCIAGAIQKVAGNAILLCSISNILTRDLKINKLHLSMYNDRISTRKKDILALLDRTIAKYK